MKKSFQTEMDDTQQAVSQIVCLCTTIALHQEFGVGKTRLDRITDRIHELEDQNTEVIMTPDANGRPSKARAEAIRESWLAGYVTSDYRIPMLRAPRGRKEQQYQIAGNKAARIAWTVTKDDKSYIKWSHTLGQAGTQYASCRVSYVGPNGKPIEGIAYVKDYDAKSKTNQQLEVYAPVTSKTEAKELAAKKLRLHNKFERQVGFTYHGDPGKVAGLTFETKSFGPWDGKYIVKQAKHTVTGSGGYTTQVSGRHVLGGY